MLFKLLFSNTVTILQSKLGKTYFESNAFTNYIFSHYRYKARFKKLNILMELSIFLAKKATY